MSEPDTLRKLAEEKLGRPISDEDWKTSRPKWKQALYMYLYGATTRQLKRASEE